MPYINIRSAFSRLLLLSLFFAGLRSASVATAATLDSASGTTFDFIIKAGDGPFRSSGRYRFLVLDSGTSYRVFNVQNVIDSTGTMTFTRFDSKSSRIDYNDSIDGSGFSLALDLVGLNYGTFTLINSNLVGSQSGDFAAYSANAPTAFSRKVLQLQVSGGSSLFPGGTYRLISTGSANYVIEDTPGTTNSFGTFTYGKLNRSSAQLNLSDATFGTAFNVLTFVTENSGIFLLRTDAGGQQIGSFTLSDFLLPSFKTQPVSQTVAVGDPVTLQASVAGTGPLSFQWQKNGVAIDGATSSSFTIPFMQVSDAGNYRIVAHNIGGSIVSSNATLTPVCNYILSPTFQSFDFSGGSGTISISTLGDCAWSVSNVPSWTTITSANTGTGLGSLTYSVAANTNDLARIARLMIGNKTFVVTQTPPPAPPSLSGKVLILSGTASTDRLLFTASKLFLGQTSSSNRTAIDLGGYDYVRSGNTQSTVTYFDGESRDLSLTFETLKTGTFSLSNTGGIISEGTFTLTVNGPDFDFDTRSDLLFQNANGPLAAWFMEQNSFLGAGLIRSGIVPSIGWHARAAGDFDDDGHTDILFQHDNGKLAIWYLNGTSFVRAGLVRGGTPVPAGWRVAGIADFNQDRHADILFQHESRVAMVWHLQGEAFLGSQLIAGGAAAGVGWRLAATGDFNGDALPDVLWQHTDQRLAVWHLVGVDRINATLLPVAPASWQALGSNDFNEDGFADVLFRNGNNQFIVWSMRDSERIDSVLLRNGQRTDPSWVFTAPR